MFYAVLWNGRPFKRWLTKAEAYGTAERYQGSHGGYHGGSGMLKHKDLRDHFEVVEDKEANKEFNERYKTYKAGDPQTVHFEQRVDSLRDADPDMT